jgi:OOP family OmpA-OmpF porin
MKIKKILLPAFAASVVLASSTAFGQDAPIVKSARILESLTAKDIVVDNVGRSAGHARNPAIDLQVQFAFNSADLLPVGRAQLDELATALSDRTLQVNGFEIIGHTDRVGTLDYNLRLSQERAVAVRNYLVTTHGVSPNRLMTTGLGFSRLADVNRPTASINRRVEIRRVEMGGGFAAPAARPAVGGGRLVPTPQ